MPATDEAVALAVAAADAADDRKATELTIIEVADVLAVVDLFVLASARSERQLRAVADSIEDRLHREHDRTVLRREGTPDSGWLLLDFGDICCHVFAAEQRDFYALERLWADVPRRDPTTGAPLAAGSSGELDRAPGDVARQSAADEDVTS